MKTDFSAVHLRAMLQEQLPTHFQTLANVQNIAQNTKITLVFPRKHIFHDSCTTTREIQHPCKEIDLRIIINKAIRFLVK